VTDNKGAAAAKYVNLSGRFNVKVKYQ